MTISVPNKIALLVVTALGLAACSKQPVVVATKPTLVRVAAATMGPAATTIEGSGVVATKDEMRLSFKVGGVVGEIDVEEGQSVRKGQRLAAIVQTEVNAEVTEAEQLANKARRELARGEALFKDEVIALEPLENLRTQASLANARLSAARFNRGYAVITAPRDAIVLRKLVQQRELVPAGQPVLVLGTNDRGYIVRGALADREIVRVKQGANARVSLDAWPELTLSGKLSEIASAADERSGMFAIEVTLDPTPAKLVTGLVAKLAILPSAIANEQRVYVPIAALLEGDGQLANVFLAVNGKAVKRQVRVAFLSGELAALSSGVSQGELVVTVGAPYLRDGEAIEVAGGADQS